MISGLGRTALNSRCERITMDKFAVIDTETNWNDEVMSIGVVIADWETKEKAGSVYYIIDPEYKAGGMFSYELRLDDKNAHITSRKQALQEIKEWLASYGVEEIFAYNASFDMESINGMILCVWPHTGNITGPYRIPRTVTRQAG